MRTAEKFATAMAQVRWFVRFHNRSVWLVPQASEYRLSVVKPKPTDLPSGTTALLFGTDESTLETVESF